MESTLPNNNPLSNDSVPMITENPPETKINQNPNAPPNNSSPPVRDTLEDIKKRLLISLELHGFVARLESVKWKAPFDSVRAKYKSYTHYLREMVEKRGVGNVKYGLYAASSKDQRDAFASYCFGSLVNDHGQFGSAFSFSAIYQSVPSEILSVAADEDGISRVLLCSIVLGKMEVVSPYSGQCGPSSEEFDSGADDLVSPSKYFMWSVNATTHVLPLYVLCFRPSEKVIGRCKSSSSGRTKPGVGSLIKDMMKFIPADAMETIGKHYLEYKNKKIKRPDMIRRLRGIVGDELLNRFMKPDMEKVLKQGKKHKPVKQKEDVEVVEGLMGQFQEDSTYGTATNS